MKKVYISAKNREQKAYIRAICENDIIIATGCPGSGKTMVACGMAAEHLAKEKIQKIILTKPLVSVSRDFPSVPGGVLEKLALPRDHILHLVGGMIQGSPVLLDGRQDESLVVLDLVGGEPKRRRILLHGRQNEILLKLWCKAINYVSERQNCTPIFV